VEENLHSCAMQNPNLPTRCCCNINIYKTAEGIMSSWLWKKSCELQGKLARLSRVESLDMDSIIPVWV
jgi:hypothetical protein